MDYSESVQIILNKKQLKLLIKSLYLADVVKTSYCPDKLKKISKEKKLMAEFLPLAIEMGFGHWMKSFNPPELDDLKEMDIYEDIQIFENLSFWSNLSQLLAERDLEELYGVEVHLDLEKSLKKELDLEDSYSKEFEENGLLNLRLIRPTEN